MLLSILALATAVAQNPLAVVHPKAVPSPLLAPGDYPAEARRRGWEGKVVADLTIDTRGRVAKCEIASSSGHKLLDETTCRILTKRARFHPAKDRDGRPIQDVVRTPEINWSSPR